MAEKTVLPGMQLPAPHPCCMPQLSADDQAAITRTFLKAHPACSQHVAVLLPEYLRFIKLKLEQPPGVVLVPSNIVDAVWHGSPPHFLLERPAVASKWPCYSTALSSSFRPAHILNTRRYAAFCASLGDGSFMHHEPDDGGVDAYKATMLAYCATFQARRPCHDLCCNIGR